jgi:NRPS condensation-like uncharacterized protein
MRRAGFTAEPDATRQHPRIAPPPGSLPRTPFGVADELTCYFDVPAEPCTVHIEVQVREHVDPDALRLAAAGALAAHPRAIVRLAAAGWWQHRRYWEQTPMPDVEPVAVTTWADEEELGRERARFLGFSPPLDCSPPVRILLAAGPGEDRIILNGHHAALDGMSCLDLLGSISQHYQEAVGAGPAPVQVQPAPPPDRPARQSAPAAAASIPAARAPAGSRPLAALPRPAARIVPDLRGEGTQRGSDRSGYGFRLLVLPVPAIPRSGQEPHPTVNDVLLTALIVAIARWNASHARPGGQIRITMPINTRPHGVSGAVGNLSRLAAITASVPADGQGLRPLLADVAAQTRWAKDHAGPQVDPVSRTLAVAPCPPAIKALMLRLALRAAGPLLCDTSLVSNLGSVADPPRFGHAPATGMWFSTYAHMPRGLSVGAVTIGGQLHLCLRYRRALFAETAASDFANAYTAALGDVTQDATIGVRATLPVSPELGA